MVFRDPVFDFALELGRPDKNLRRFGPGCDVGKCVVDSISLSPTGLEVVGILITGFPSTSLMLSNGTR